MFEVKGTARRYQVFIDGALFKEAKVIEESLSQPGVFDIETTTFEASQQLAEYRIDDLGESIRQLVLPYEFDWFDFIEGVEVTPKSYWAPNANEYFELLFRFKHAAFWRGFHSFQEYAEELIRLIDQPKYRDVHASVDGNGVGFHACYRHCSIEEEILQRSETLRHWHEEVVLNLFARLPSNSLVTTFEFPREIRSYCEQYLVYFIQFLRDVGVEATSEIRHVAGKVLFSVTPTDRTDALDNIRSALDAYLQLPFNPVSEETGSEIAVQRLESAVHRLKSDLKLASAELQAKNMTIEAQQLMITVQKGLLGGELTLPTKDATPKVKDDDRGGIIRRDCGTYRIQKRWCGG